MRNATEKFVESWRNDDFGRVTRHKCAGPRSGARAAAGAPRRVGEETFDELEAIREVSVDVADGEFVSVLGPSGCGKSTLLMMIAGLIEPSAGEIRIKGAKVGGASP